jgi:hypothetical protein
MKAAGLLTSLIPLIFPISPLATVRMCLQDLTGCLHQHQRPSYMNLQLLGHMIQSRHFGRIVLFISISFLQAGGDVADHTGGSGREHTCQTTFSNSTYNNTPESLVGPISFLLNIIFGFSQALFMQFIYSSGFLVLAKKKTILEKCWLNPGSWKFRRPKHRCPWERR